MSNGFSWRVEEAAGGVRFALVGIITEKSDFSPLLQKKAEHVVLDLSEVERINSAGVGGWIVFVKSLTSSRKEVILDRCSVPIVHQMNMLTNMTGGAKIRSVQLPYVCNNCGAEQQETLDLEAHSPSSIQLQLTCPECGGEMEFDEMPDGYFTFYRRLNKS
jgi:hypothetical protein